MKRYTQSDYSVALKSTFKKNEVLEKVSLILVILSFFILTLLLRLLFTLPQAIYNYLAYTLPFSFSSSEIEALISTSPEVIYSKNFILVIYWGFLSFASLFSICSIIYYPLYLKKHFFFLQSNRYKINRSIYYIDRIIERINIYYKEDKKRHLSSLKKLLIFTDIYPIVCPIKKEWFKYPNYQWFDNNSLQKEYRDIVFSLSKFLDALYHLLLTGESINEYILPLQHLRVFLLKVTNRLENNVKIIDLDDTSELDTLIMFSKYAKIFPKYSPIKQSFYEKLSNFFRNFVESKLTIFVFVMILSSSILLIIGAVAFKLDPTQSFKLWYTVVAGSIITAFTTEIVKSLAKRKKSKETKNN